MSDFVCKLQYVYLYLITFIAVAVKIPFNGSTCMTPIGFYFIEKNAVHSELFLAIINPANISMSDQRCFKVEDQR